MSGIKLVLKQGEVWVAKNAFILKQKLSHGDCGGGLVVSVNHFYTSSPGSNPSEV